MWRCAASLERLTAEIKTSFGQPLVKDLARPALGAHVLWSIGRLGARVLLYGPANTVVPKETAERWLDALIVRDYAEGREAADAVFALGQLGRMAGDRVRDIDADLRPRVLAKMTALGASEEDLRPVREYTEHAGRRARRRARRRPADRLALGHCAGGGMTPFNSTVDDGLVSLTFTSTFQA